MPVVDLNADLAEGEALTARDLAVLDVVTSASVACGFHAGNRRTMRAAAAACRERGVALGAHVAYRDRHGFGRRALDVPAGRLAEDVLEQWAALAAEAAAVGAPVTYVKAHGALYHRLATDPEAADAFVAALAPHVGLVVGPPAGALHLPARAAGLRVVAEGFPDRAYEDDGGLTPRDRPGAVVADGAEVARRARSLVLRGGVPSVHGRWTDVVVDTLCIHGDAPGAPGAARAVRLALEEAGVEVRPFAPGPERPAGRP